MKNKPIVSLFCAVLACVTFVGCGPKAPAGLPKLTPCTLTIQYEDGSPVSDAMVALAPENPEICKFSMSGKTDSSGKVVIRTHGDFSGAPAGKYKVSVAKGEWFDTGKLDEYGSPLMDTKPLVAEEFSNAAKSPLSIEIGGSSFKETLKVKKP